LTRQNSASNGIARFTSIPDEERFSFTNIRNKYMIEIASRQARERALSMLGALSSMCFELRGIASIGIIAAHASWRI